ncbi:MAG: carbonate dehydratase [Burkholderiales bacterium]
MSLDHLLAHNRAWAAQMVRERPSFFTNLKNQQKPKYMWIGCSDSRVPANQITGLEPGEVFVHRNVANVVVHSDLNALSTVQYAVDMLNVEHVIVCGHYGCGGVQAALDNARIGLADNWIRHIQDVRDRYRKPLEGALVTQRLDMLCELNVIEQVVNLCQTTVLKDAWLRSHSITVHGWIYGVSDGLVHDLDMSVQGAAGLELARERAVAQVLSKNRR